MAKADVTNYSALANEGNPFVQQPTNNTENEVMDSDDDNDTHHSGIMIHVVPDTSKSKYNCKKKTIETIFV